MNKLSLTVILLIASCSTDSGNYSSQSNVSTESRACKNARSMYQACLFSCMGTTVGSVVTAFSSCASSNKCDYAKSNIFSTCN